MKILRVKLEDQKILEGLLKAKQKIKAIKRLRDLTGAPLRQAKDAIANTASGKVTLPGGVATGFTGLTPNGTVYLQGDGTVSNSTATIAVEIGKSYNATTVLLKGI